MNAVRSVALGLTSLLLGSVLACAWPLVALAALARSMPARFAYAMVALTWCVDQLLGFTVRHYPHDVSTYGWGLAIGAAALIATFAARRAPTLLIGAVAAFISDQMVLLAYGALARDAGNFDAATVAKIALGNAIGLVALAPIAYVHILLARPKRTIDRSNAAP